MFRKLSRLFNSRTVTIQIPEISHETATGVLVEWEYRHAWLPKEKIRIEQKEDAFVIELPRWLYELKF